MHWFIYILSCSDNSYYVGITNNLKRRETLHNLGKGSKYLLSKLPVKLIYSEEYPDKSSARKREIQLKGWSRIKKEKLIQGKLNFEKYLKSSSGFAFRNKRLIQKFSSNIILPLFYHQAL